MLQHAFADGLFSGVLSASPAWTLLATPALVVPPPGRGRSDLCARCAAHVAVRADAGLAGPGSDGAWRGHRALGARFPLHYPRSPAWKRGPSRRKATVRPMPDLPGTAPPGATTPAAAWRTGPAQLGTAGSGTVGSFADLVRSDSHPSPVPGTSYSADLNEPGGGAKPPLRSHSVKFNPSAASLGARFHTRLQGGETRIQSW